MFTDRVTVNTGSGCSLDLVVHSCNTVVVGAGAAGLKCVNALYSLGVRDIALCVDRLGAGTSNNSGSDKQTYYKMGVFGSDADSPADFAETLFCGGMMHGDIAYVEGLGSLPAFFELCRIGVPFPCNEFGAYVGYKTDHDPRQRATSAGPKTSHYMVQQFLREARACDIRIFDRHQAVRLLTTERAEEGRGVCGLVCVDLRKTHEKNFGLTLFNATNVVLATGGPGELFKISVWPRGQTGSHGLALEAGVVANNLTEFQYGLASTGFRWNLSGTYQQVIPDYFSTAAADGSGERRHFLHDFFPDMPSMANAIFLKGYQWPFHAERLQDGGSSLIDIAVHLEMQKGRHVFLDFTQNPVASPDMSPFALHNLPPEARLYLERSGATQETPLERLRHMNPQSIDIYAEHGVDLRKPLAIAVCAQHCNGGLRGNIWWETNLRHLFAIGELNGTHGVRPGGSALNSGQVGAFRAAQFIASVYKNSPSSVPDFMVMASGAVARLWREYVSCLDNRGIPLKDIRSTIQARMSATAAFVRERHAISKALAEAKRDYLHIQESGIACSSPRQLPIATENRQLALTGIAILSAMDYYLDHEGGSRGGFMVLNGAGDREISTRHGGILRHQSENLALRREILNVSLSSENSSDFVINAEPVRPIPTDTSWYETTWAAWEKGEIYRSPRT